MSLSRLLVFLTVVVALVGGLHFYFWLRLVRAPQLPAAWRFRATAALVSLGALLPLSFALARRVPLSWARVFAWPAFVWMGLTFFLFLMLLLTDAVRGALAAGRLLGVELVDPGRRTWLARLLAAGAGGAAGALAAAAMGQALDALHVKEVEVRLPKLPRASDGTTIVQLTDVHVGPTIGRAFVEDLVRKVNALAPDVIVITGDLVDGSVEALRDAVAPLGDLRARHGVYFVTGNHEYFSGVVPWMDELRRLGIRVLANERVAIGEGEGGFDLAGIHDHAARRMGNTPHVADLPGALKGRDPNRALVLLAHQPKAITEAARHGVCLQLSGHTHAGQIWPWGYLVRLDQPYVAGLHRRGDTQIYVSPGTGYWGPPMRLGTHAEITKVTLLSGRA